MEKFKVINSIKEIYHKNQNIVGYLKSLEGREYNTVEDIMISYDFQTGTYINGYRYHTEFKNQYVRYLADIIDNLGEYKSILEVGVGEATTLGPLLTVLKKQYIRYYGFDISWSRIKYAKEFLKELGKDEGSLFTGDLFSAPIKDNSIDIVYTSHSIEPNGGREKEALKELYRITNKYLVLLEPSYEFASEEARERMRHHGYVTNLYETAKELGYNVVEHRLFELSSTALNPTGLIVIKKEEIESIEEPLCCPVTKTDIREIEGTYYSEESFLAYPIIQGIPCMLPQNAILATKFL